MRLPCDLMGVQLHGRTLAQHTHGPGLYPHHHKNRKRDTQQHGTINFSCHLVSNCYDFQRNSLLTILKTIRRCEEAMEHVGPPPGRALGALSWPCPSTNKPEPQILNSQSDTQEAPNAKWPQEEELLLTHKCLKLPHTQGSEGSKFTT